MSSLKDLASLIMVPSLVKDGRLDTVKPLGNSIIHPDATGNNDGTDGSTPAEGNFTFSRGSNLAATRVDVNGLIEKGRENLLVRSNQFDTTWVKGGTTLTSGQSGYDSTNNAWLLSKGAASYTRITQDIAKSGVHSVSVYAKANTLSQATIYVFATGDNPYAIFNLVNGSVVSSGSIIDSNATSVGNDWWRLSITFNATTQSINFYPDFSQSTAGSIYIQDAQLESSLVATDYIETGASTAQAGILEDLPRLDYSGGASCPALLLEPQRTNLMVHSELLSSFGGTATINENSIVSPEGVQNAAEVVLSSSGTDSFYKEANVTASSKYTLSFYVKQGSNTNNELAVRDQTNASFIATDISYTASPTEWKRIDYTFTTPSGCTEVRIYPHRSSSSSVGNGYFYGVQLEQGSYPTSYIPTYGSAVTRSSESLSKYDLTDSLSQTLFIECGATGYAGGGGEIIFEKSNPVAAIFRIYIEIDNSGTTQSRVRLRTEFPVNNYDFNLGNKEDYKKIALSIDGGNVKFFGNGSLLGTYEVTPTIMEQLNWRMQSSKFSTKQFLLFPTALTDSECIALTTI